MDTGSLATRADSDGDTDKRAGTCGSCGQRVAKHLATIDHTPAADTVNDADHADALYCGAIWHTPGIRQMRISRQ